MRAEIENVARCVVMIVLSIVLVAGWCLWCRATLLWLKRPREEEAISSQVEGAELLAAGVNVDEEQASELYDTNIEDANCHQLRARCSLRGRYDRGWGYWA